MIPKPAAAAAPNAAFLKQVNDILVTEQANLEKELAKLAKPNPNLSDDYDGSFPDYGDKEDENAAEVAEYATNLSLEQTLEKSLRDVKAALERLKKGTYGLCKYCGKPIDQRRLSARPTSSSCVECKKAITQEI